MAWEVRIFIPKLEWRRSSLKFQEKNIFGFHSVPVNLVDH